MSAFIQKKAEENQKIGIARRLFLGQTAAALLAGVVVQIDGRLFSTTFGGVAQACTDADLVGIIAVNHGHKAIVNAAQLAQGEALFLDITGAGSHGHELELTAEDLTLIGSGGKLTKDSSTTGAHSHGVTFNPDTVGTVATNHGHAAVLTTIELNAGVAVVLDLHGTATHTHTIDLSDVDLFAIQKGHKVVKTSTAAGAHTHVITFNPAGLV